MSDLRRRLMDGRVDLHRVGVVAAATGTLPPFVVVDGEPFGNTNYAADPGRRVRAHHSDGDPDEDAIFAATQARGLGCLGWSYSGNGGGVAYLDMVTNFDPAQLTSWGQRIFNGANGIRETAGEATVHGSRCGPGTPLAEA